MMDLGKLVKKASKEDAIKALRALRALVKASTEEKGKEEWVEVLLLMEEQLTHTGSIQFAILKSFVGSKL